eukprot:SAG22_NODE_1465_length_4355_cov_31.402491_2_plen_142_part_00
MRWHQAEIEEACRQTKAFDFIMELPEKWRTPAHLLSGGQRQLIAITRALLANPRILLLDEVTSALDADLQEEVTKAVEKLMENRLTIQIAHRLVVLQNCDQIVCLDDGCVAQVRRRDCPDPRRALPFLALCVCCRLTLRFH